MMNGFMCEKHMKPLYRQDTQCVHKLNLEDFWSNKGNFKPVQIVFDLARSVF